MADITVRQVLLGLRPYVLVEMTGILAEDAETGDLDVATSVSFGGGLDAGTARELLSMAVEQMPEPVDAGDPQ